MFGNLVYDIGYGGTTPRPDWVRDAHSVSLLQASRHAIDDLVARRRGEPARVENVEGTTN
jgi:membrane protein required for colicin V production